MTHAKAQLCHASGSLIGRQLDQIAPAVAQLVATALVQPIGQARTRPDLEPLAGPVTRHAVNQRVRLVVCPARALSCSLWPCGAVLDLRVLCPQNPEHRLPRSDIEQHMRTNCPRACPRGCPAAIPVSDFAAHRAVCPKEPVPCPAADAMCPQVTPRCEMHMHAAACPFVAVHPAFRYVIRAMQELSHACMSYKTIHAFSRALATLVLAR